MLPRDGGVAATEDAPRPRPKSRNDLYELKAVRYGWEMGNGKATVDVAHIKDELEFADWYGELEEKLEDASNEEYRYGDAYCTTMGMRIDTPDAGYSIRCSNRI